MKPFPLLLALAAVAFVISTVGAEEQIKWGQPINGLRIGVESSVTATTSDQDLRLKVTAQNISRTPITLPAPTTFVLASNPQSDDYHASPLSPLIEKTLADPATAAAESPWNLGDSGVPANQISRDIVELAPGQSITWKSIPLEKYSYFGDRLPPDNRTKVQKWFLLPGYIFHLGFRFENEQKKMSGKTLWTGRADSGLVDVTISPPSIADLRIEGTFSLPKDTYFVGEPIETTFTVRNLGDAPFDFPGGGDYRGSGRHDRYTIRAVDEHGQTVPDPVAPSGIGGGLGGHIQVSPDKPYTEKLLVNQWCALSKPGKYTITCQRTLGILRAAESNRDSYSRPESSLPKSLFEKAKIKRID